MFRNFKNNWHLYFGEALGLAIFMVSACYCSALLFSPQSPLYYFFSDDMMRNLLMGPMMGSTALFIFYFPVTAASGAHINPAVTITFLRLKKIEKRKAFCYILFQFAGGTAAVYIMQWLMGTMLTDSPVNSAVTVPGKSGVINAAAAEFIIAFVMMTMVLFTSASATLKKHTRILAALLVTLYVIVAGPVSGFGMNPARTFASAFPSGIYTAFWIYMIIPFAGMLLAAECFLSIKSIKKSCRLRVVHRNIHLKKSNDEKVYKDLTY